MAGTAANYGVSPPVRQGYKRSHSGDPGDLGGAGGHAERVECVVIGAGAVGLACARRLAMAGLEVIVAGGRRGHRHRDQFAATAEVIHAGIYYPAGSFKAWACVEGKHFLYDYCAERGLPHKRIGKLIVASDESRIPELEALQARAAANGVPDLELLTGAEVRALEPAVKAEAGLLSPSTGIIDSHALMLAFQGDAEELGAAIAFHAPVVSAARWETASSSKSGGAGADDAGGRAGRQQRRAGRTDVAARIDGLDRAAYPEGPVRQGQLFLRRRPPALPPPRLSHAGGLRAGRARHAGSGRPVQIRPGSAVAGDTGIRSGPGPR